MRKVIPYPLIGFLLLLILPLPLVSMESVSANSQNISYGIVLDLFYIVIAFLSMFYFLALYIYDVNQPHNLYFSAFCCSSGLIGLFSGTRLTQILFSLSLSSQSQILTRNVLIIFCLITVLLYNHSILPELYSKKTLYPLIGILILYLIPCIFLWKNYATELFGIRLMLQFLCGCYCLISVLYQTMHHNRKFRPYILGCLVLFLTIPTELLLYHNVDVFYHLLLACLDCFISLQINTLIQRDIQTHRKELDTYSSYVQTLASIKKEETNLISSYLRPHFLFNALNIIGGYCLIDTHRAKELTIALMTFLSKLLEHDNLSGTTPLSEEIALMQSYGMIQSERFTFLTISYDIEENLPELPLPSLTLQPLLDNAINHGVRKKNSLGEIRVSIHREDSHLSFTIHDTGVGINPELIPSLFIRKEDGLFHSLYHINARLNEQYGEGITFTSTPNIGTTVSFRIPNH